MVKAMLKKRIQVNGSKVLMLGLTFKENCPDLRNTRVIDLVRELRDYGVEVDVYDPWADAEDARDEYGLDLVTPRQSSYDGIVLAVAHQEFAELGEEGLRELARPNHVIYDLKYLLSPDAVDLRL
jgi:UDP-N-acetyl-D-galactosamine dehydrogenase